MSGPVIVAFLVDVRDLHKRSNGIGGRAGN
jgi:hypothetical protein